MDPLLCPELWRILAHAAVPLVIAASVRPEGANQLRVWISIAAAFIIQLLDQFGLDLNTITDAGFEPAHFLQGLVGGFLAHMGVYKAIDGALPDGVKLNELILPNSGLSEEDYIDY